MPQEQNNNNNEYFLEALAKFIYQRDKTEISNFCFVFPSRRSGIFFKHYLGKITDAPIWSPSVLTINEFAQLFTSILPVDSLTLLFKLYHTFKELTNTNQSFDDFIPWGEMILSDFNDIDNYLSNPKTLFSNLLSIKEIETDYSFLTPNQVEAIRVFWSSFSPEKLSNEQKMFIQNWELLYPFYTKFNQALEAENLAYSGAINRQIAETITSFDIDSLSFKKIIFCGFFVLTPAEQKLFNGLQKKGIAEFYWDYSPWIMGNSKVFNAGNQLPFKDAGWFMNENITHFPSPAQWHLPQTKQWPEITITGVSRSSEQLRIVTRFLTEEASSNKSDKNRTAILLTNESFLIPTLHAIPPEYDKINVSLGYPLKSTPVFSLLDAVFNLQKNARSTAAGKSWFYHRDVMPLLQHAYISLAEPIETLSIKERMISRNSLFIEASELTTTPFFEHLFTVITHGHQFPNYIEKILLTSYQLLTDESNFEQEFVFAAYKQVIKLGDLLNNLQESVLPKTWLQLFRRMAQNVTVPFKGEPLNGLQVMGVLETRAIDFDAIAILHMNEGIFPKNSPPNSFIPNNLRIGFGLPTLEHQDAIFYYYFFRLIHRAKKVQLLYLTSGQDFQTGEMSRYLYQLFLQYKGTVRHEIAIEKLTLEHKKSLTASKTPDVIAQINQYGSEGIKKLSPSAISQYIECTLRFYFKYICRLKENEEIIDDPDARIFGLLFHTTIEKLYKPFTNKLVSESEFKSLLNNKVRIEEALKESFTEHFSDKAFDPLFADYEGKNQLVYDVLFKYTQQFIENDCSQAPIFIKGLETVVNTTIRLESDHCISLQGTIDRLDEVQNQIRVIDYKTGKGENKIAELSYLFDPQKHSKLKAIFQTLLYSHMLKASSPPHLPIYPTVVWLKSLFKSSNYQLIIGARSNASPLSFDQVETEFIDQLKTVLEELFNPDIPFMQTNHIESCVNCPYNYLCNRK